MPAGTGHHFTRPKRWTLSLLNGPLASVAGNSSLNIAGALVSFTGGLQAVRIALHRAASFFMLKTGAGYRNPHAHR